MKIREMHWLWLIPLGWVAVIGPGTIEGKYFPAASPMELTALYFDRDKQSVGFFGRSARLRPECNYEAIEGRLGTRNGRSVPAKIDTGQPAVRKDGSFSFGPWFINLPSTWAFKNYSYVDVLHRCYYFGVPSLWLTRSRIWR